MSNRQTLTIDVGNSIAKWMLFDGDAPIDRGICNDLFISDLAAFIHARQVSHAAIAEVNRQVAQPILSSLQMCECSLSVVNSASELPFKIIYSTPHTLGADRIAAAAGAFAIATDFSAALIIDAGTCITYDLVANGEFVGGNIAPGMRMRLKSMHEQTSALPLVELREPGNLIGKTTHEAMLNGAYWGVIFEIRSLMAQLRTCHPDLITILTGGDAAIIISKLENYNVIYDSSLVFKGLNLIASRESNKQK